MKKSVLILLLCVTILLLFSCKEALPETGDFVCEFDTDNKTAAITGYNGSEESVTVPDKFGGYAVTSIERNAFKENYDLAEITFPETLETIGNSAFELCISLESVTLPESLLTIGNTAFANCRNLETVVIAENVSKIGICVFTGCTSLEEINIVGNNANYSADRQGVLFNKDRTQLIQYPLGSSYETYTVPEGVTEISSYAFEKTQNLQKVTLPSSVKTIGSYAFQASSITEAVLGDGVEEIGNFGFNESRLITVALGSSLKKLGDSAFAWCTSLEEITLPEAVEKIGQSAFYMCTSVKKYSVSENNAYYKSDSFGAVFNKEMTQLLYYPLASKEETYTVPETVKEIASRAFSPCLGLKTVTIPDSVETINEYAFADCANLKNIEYLGTKPETIAENAFGE